MSVMKREASEAVDDLFRSRWGPSVRLATALTGDRGVAEELVQDALLEVTRRRAALVLRYYEDLPVGEIARLLDCQPGTVSSLLHRGLADLRKVLDHDA
jgi:DNA-directed RNA polymerase specialized sigma24 family protein